MPLYHFVRVCAGTPYVMPPPSSRYKEGKANIQTASHVVAAKEAREKQAIVFQDCTVHAAVAESPTALGEPLPLALQAIDNDKSITVHIHVQMLKSLACRRHRSRANSRSA